MAESTQLRFTYLRLFLTVAQAAQNGGAASLPLTFGYRSREAAEEIADRLREHRKEVMCQARDATVPLSPDFRIRDHFDNDFDVDVRTICSIGVVDPVSNGNLGSLLQLSNLKAQMHHEKRVKDEPALSEWLRRHQQPSLIHPAHMPPQ